MAQLGRPREYDRDAVLDRAVLLFWERGYDATSLSSLLGVAGMSSASFYNAFGSKREFFKASMERYAATFGSVFGPLSDGRLAPREAVEATLLGSIRMQTDGSHPRGCLITLSGVIVAPDADSASAARFRDQTRVFYRNRIEQAVARGELGADVDVGGLATLFECLQWGLSTDARDGVPPDRLIAAVRQVMQRLWGGPVDITT